MLNPKYKTEVLIMKNNTAIVKDAIKPNIKTGIIRWYTVAGGYGFIQTLGDCIFR